jgi:hypothetical protein
VNFGDWFESKLGFKVGFGSGLKTIADKDGSLYQGGTKLTATAAEINKLDNLTGEKVVKSVTGLVAFNVASPFTVSLGTAPAGATILAAIVEVVTAFNAATTNVLVVGTAADDDAYVAAADVNEAAAGTTTVAHSATLAGDIEILAKYTQTGTAATAGSARVTVLYLV